MSVRYQDAIQKTRLKRSSFYSMLMSTPASLRLFMTLYVSCYCLQSTNATSRNSSAQPSDQPSFHSLISIVTKTVQSSLRAMLNLRSYKSQTSFHIIFHLQQMFWNGKLVMLSTSLLSFAHFSSVLDMMLMLFMALLQKRSLPRTSRL